MQYRCGDFEGRRAHPVSPQLHASRENHFGEDILVSRKGAIEARWKDKARPDTPALWALAATSCAGRGNAESFNTAPHGAGRRMSRRKARDSFTMTTSTA